jgi:hypothetical protein
VFYDRLGKSLIPHPGQNKVLGGKPGGFRDLLGEKGEALDEGIRL